MNCQIIARFSSSIACPKRETDIRKRGRKSRYLLCVGSVDSSCMLTGEIFSDLGGPWKPMGPGPPAAPTRCITPAPPISAALPLLRTSRDGFRAILKPFVPAVPFKFVKLQRRLSPFPSPRIPLFETQNPPRVKSLRIREIHVYST